MFKELDKKEKYNILNCWKVLMIAVWYIPFKHIGGIYEIRNHWRYAAGG